MKPANKTAIDREETKMKGESAFRATAAALLLAAAAVSGYHRRKAEAASPEKISAVEEEGLLTAVALRLSGLALMLSVAAYVLNPRWMAWSSVRLPVAVRWAGAGLATATLPLSWWVFKSIGKNITPTVATREEHELVTARPFRWVRHPLYATGTTFFASLSVVAANWFMGLASLSVLVMLLVRLPEEEERLLERFGGEYTEYMKRTGRLLPRLLRAK
jgi:protein-S-isoprenylcysteine O-methyltransferase Ste14